ncbi:FUSC family protein [Nocardia sp. NPDC051030]|uniref:FUSC family protein n=1 Tax=Nocardia sp. NPDC051030 TaxID=3155162 RepID=UPI0034152169
MTSVPHSPQLPTTTRLRTLLFALPPIGHRWGPGVRSAAALGIPATLLVATGHAPWALLTAFGAFAVMYADGRPARTRLRSAGAAGLGLLLCTSLGALLGRAVAGHAAAPAVTVGALTAVAVVAVYVVNALRPGPPGALFFVLTCAGAMVAAEGGVAAATIVGSAAIGLAGALVVTLASVGIDRRWGDWTRPPAQPSAAYRLRRSWSPNTHAVTTAARVGVACAVAGGIAASLHWFRPHWAVISALVVLSQGPHLTGGRVRALQRFAGTTAGLLLFAGIYQLSPSGYALIAVVAALMFAIELFIAANYALAVLFMTPVALLTGGAGAVGGSAGSMIRDRFAETLIGVIVAVICLSMVAPHAHRRGFYRTQRRMRATARELLNALQEPMDEHGRRLCRDLRFELISCENVGIDCANNDSRWIRPRWQEHAALMHEGHGLLEAAEATPVGEYLPEPERWAGVFDEDEAEADPKPVA